MKHTTVVIAAVIALLLYTAINFYCIRRASQALTGLGTLNTVIVCGLIALSCAFPAGRIIELFVKNSLTHYIVLAGSLYLGFMFYLFFITLSADGIRFGNFIFHFLPRRFLYNPYPLLRSAWLVTASVLTVTVGTGYWIATHPRLRTIDVTIDKKSSSLNMLTIAAVSDIHFGTVLGEDHLIKIIRLIKQANPDLVLLVGDIFDEDVDETKRQGMVSLLRELACPLGVYAVTGNHDYYSGLSKAVETLRESGVSVLQDSAVRINDAFILAGRKDLTAVRWGQTRLPLREILTNTDRRLPCILMDHQPFHLEEAAENKVDLQFSGHTHHGQLFPLNILYRWIYETSWGRLRKGSTQFVVSCGAGTWGPPVRTNSPSEVLKIRLNFH